MNISRISRSIIVVIFVIFIIFLSFLNISNLFNGGRDVGTTSTSLLLKVGFVFAVILFTFIYMYIKDKLYKKHVKRKLSFIYRYIYIILVLLGTSLFSIKSAMPSFSDSKMIFHISVSIITAFIIKKIIFNVSKSDILSVFGMFIYTMFPNVNANTEIYVSAMIFNMFFLSSILILQILIDELKQKGVKTNKYIIETVVFGVLAGITTLLGISVFAWIVIILLTIFITYNLDNTHINFPKKFMASLTQSKRESLYKIERININKLIVVILLSIVLILIINFMGRIILDKLSNNVHLNFVISQIEDVKISEVFSKDFNIKEIARSLINKANVYLLSAPRFYLCVYVYILFMEALAFFLHRRYDTKSTLMKLILIVLFVMVSVFDLNIYYFSPVFTVLSILIAIVNTSNIYLNREERIKMLVA